MEQWGAGCWAGADSRPPRLTSPGSEPRALFLATRRKREGPGLPRRQSPSLRAPGGVASPRPSPVFCSWLVIIWSRPGPWPCGSVKSPGQRMGIEVHGLVSQGRWEQEQVFKCLRRHGERHQPQIPDVQGSSQAPRDLPISELPNRGHSMYLRLIRSHAKNLDSGPNFHWTCITNTIKSH